MEANYESDLAVDTTKTSEVLPRPFDVEATPPLDAARPWEPSQRSLVLKSLLMAADAVAFLLGASLAFVIATEIAGGVRDSFTLCIEIFGVTLPLWLLIFSRYRLYSSRFVSIRMTELGRVVHATLAGTLAMGGAAYLMAVRAPRSWVILSFPCVLVFTCIEREMVRATFSRVRRSGRMLRPVVLVGANEEARSILELTEHFPALGYRVVGVVDDGSARQLQGITVCGRIEDTLQVIQSTKASGVIVATTAVTSISSNRLVRELMDAGVHVELSSSLHDIDAERLVVRQIGAIPSIYIEPVRRGGWRAAAKRAFDILGAALGLLLASPVLLLVALAVTTGSEGGPFFSQVRVGRDGKPFRVYKFRTMVKDAETRLASLQSRNEADGPLFKLSDDPRVTPIGKWLRRYSIDELPQFWNILRGEMSMVGPRPALYREMEDWTPEFLRSRLRVRPGLTGMWQVSGRSSLSFADYVRLDLYYVDNWSLWRDLAIVAKTIPQALKQHGAH